jgi:ATP adenylyltransferase/5',5'''-P-1,P-4-tetraphosphate phosphorylase II
MTITGAKLAMNSLAYAGTMAVKNEEGLEYIREQGPIAGVLNKLAVRL